MIRHSILPRPLPTVLLMLLAVAAPTLTVRSQDRGTQDRLDQLERDLSMLQRQVYRSGGPVMTPGSSTAVDAELRMDRLETQMRELTGRIEAAVNEVEQLRRRLEQINSDIDVRVSQGQVAAPPPPSRAPGSGAVANTAPMRGSSPPASASPFPPPGNPVPPPNSAATFGTLTPPRQMQQALDLPNSPGSGSLHPPSPGMLPDGSASDQYNFAFGLMKQADYPAAEDALRAFIQQHPDDPLAGNAQYWLGETYYARRRYAEAAGAFAEGYKRYPKGTKAADNLLKLGMSLARADQKQNACIALAQLDRDFPNPGNPIKDQAAKEKKQLGC